MFGGVHGYRSTSVMIAGDDVGSSGAGAVSLAAAASRSSAPGTPAGCSLRHVSRVSASDLPELPCRHGSMVLPASACCCPALGACAAPRSITQDEKPVKTLSAAQRGHGSINARTTVSSWRGLPPKLRLRVTLRAPALREAAARAAGPARHRSHCFPRLPSVPRSVPRSAPLVPSFLPRPDSPSLRL